MPKKAKLNGIAPTFVVPNVVKTAEFYRDMLGFEILGYFAEPPVYAMVRRDSVEIHFGKADDGVATQVNEMVRRGLGNDVYVFVSDVGALLEEYSGRGVKIIEGPIRRIYGCTEIVIRDCNGFQIVFGE